MKIASLESPNIKFIEFEIVWQQERRAAQQKALHI